MQAKHLILTGITVLMITTLALGAAQALESPPAPLPVKSALENVRDYAPAPTQEHVTYAVDAGVLFAGGPGAWRQIRTPDDIIVGAVAVDGKRPDLVYIGAANQLSLYRSTDRGASWQPVPLSDAPGGVTSIAVDAAQRLVYAGTDTAGVFRLRDVGASLVVGGQLLLDEPVRQVVADSTGASHAIVRTDSALYRAENYGLTWTQAGGLHSAPTALAIADAATAVIYVGTTDRGVLASADGRSWSMVNEGLGLTPGARVHVDALAIDPQQPQHLYAAISFLYGSTTLHQTPSRIVASIDGAKSWSPLDDNAVAAVSGTVDHLLPVAGSEGAVYALSTLSRAPLALFDESTQAESASTKSAAETLTQVHPTAPEIPFLWVIAALASLTLGLAITYDLRQRSMPKLPSAMSMSALDTQTVSVVNV